MDWINSSNSDNRNNNSNGFNNRGRGGRGGRGARGRGGGRGHGGGRGGGGGYQGANFDPDYHNRRGGNHQGDNANTENHPRQGGYQGHNYDPDYQNRRDRDRARGNGDHRNTMVSTLPMLFLMNFTATIVAKLERDIEGDHRVCTCTMPNGGQCYHAIVDLYANNLRQVAELQSEVVALVEFLMTSGDEPAYHYIRGRIEVYLAQHPNTLLDTVLRTIGRAGVVTIGTGVFTGQGMGVIFDGHVPTPRVNTDVHVNNPTDASGGDDDDIN